MLCANCGFENPAYANFCEECGCGLMRRCAACGEKVGPTAKFCQACGSPIAECLSEASGTSGSAIAKPLAPVHYTPPHLAERILAEWTATEARGGAFGERKTITALFADMAGSTALIQDLDPEEARRLIDPVMTLMMDAVHHYEGYVVKFLGDGILALFGAPIAHEDHALRALYAALRMQEAMRRHSDIVRLDHGVPLEIRVGIHSGEVVVRSIRKDDLHTDYDPVGHTIHIASRMEGMARPGSILVSASSYKLAQGYFTFRALGTTQVKGVREPLDVYEVQGLGALRTRLQIAAHRGLARFVGRQEEMQRLQGALAVAREAHGQVVGVQGEAGVGKSRLFHEFKARSSQDWLLLETFSVSHGKAFAYLPLIELLKTYFQITPEDSDRACREKVMGKLLALDRSLESHLPYLLYLIGTAESDSVLSNMDTAVRRKRTFDAIASLLVRESSNQPLLLIFEDLQWLDIETTAFLDLFLDYVAGAKIVLLVNYRPEHGHDWGTRDYYTQLLLEPLGPEEAQGLLTALLGDDCGLVSLKRLVMEKTEGNPFFMEEVVQTLVEEGALLGHPGCYRIGKAPSLLHIPTTVQGVLAARIDRLAFGHKDLLQVLAVIGKEFPLTLVQQVTALPEDKLRPLLADLQAADFIYERPAYPDIEYAFKHALTQEVAGNSLLSERRSALHERTAQAIETLFQSRLKDYCSQLAHHYSKSGNIPKAVEYLHCAGQQALQRSALTEAIRQLSSAIELQKQTPVTLESAREELTLRLTLGPALTSARGQASPEVESNYKCALALCETEGQTQYVFPALVGLWTFYQLRARYETAQSLGKRLLDLASKSGQPGHLAEAHRTLGATAFRLGLLDEARTHMVEVLALQRPAESTFDYLLGYGRDPAVHAMAALGWTLWYLGMPDQALSYSHRAVALARARPDAYNLALCLVFAAEVHQCRGECDLTREYAKAALAVSDEQGLPFYLGLGAILQGWALAHTGSHEEGIARILHGLQACETTGAALGRPGLLALLAEAYGQAGRTETALERVAEGLLIADETGEQVDKARLHRLQGELMLQQSKNGLSMRSLGDAEACFHKAIAVAHAQRARALELQGTLSLAGLWKRQGRADDARRVLAAIRTGSQEGGNLPDCSAP